MLIATTANIYALLDERFQSTPFHGVYAGSNPAQGTSLIITECGGIGKRVERGRLEGNLTI